MADGFVLVLGGVLDGVVRSLTAFTEIRENVVDVKARIISEHTSHGLATIDLTDSEEFDGNPDSVLWRPVLSSDPVSLGVKPAAVNRIINVNDFMRRFTLQEDVAFETIGETDPVLRVLTRRLMTRDTINLDHPEVIAGLEYMKQVGVPVVWATNEIADDRIAQLRA